MTEQRGRWWFLVALSLLAACAGSSGSDRPSAPDSPEAAMTSSATPSTEGPTPTTATTEAAHLPASSEVTIGISTTSDWTLVSLASGHSWRRTGPATLTGSPDWAMTSNEISIGQSLENAISGSTVGISLPLDVTGLDSDPVLMIELRRGDLGVVAITVAAEGGRHELDDPGGPITDRIRYEVDTGGPAPSEPSGPDWIFSGGTVITITQGRAEAVAVTADRIEAVGSESEIMALAGPSTRIIDLAGGALLPGFIDAHSHAFQNDGAAAQDLILQGGVTTVTEMTTPPETLALLYELDGRGELRVRVSAYLVHTNVCGEVHDEWWRDQLDRAAETVSGAMLQLTGVKIFTDGGACNGITRSFPVTAGLPNGPLYFDDADLVEIVRGLDASGYTAGIHALGDLAVHQVLDTYELVIDGGSNPLRHRMEHNALVHPDDRDRYDSAGMVATIFGAFPACGFRDNLANGIGTPAEYMDYEWPYAELIEQNPNTTFAWHVDYPYFFDWDVPTHLLGFTTRAEQLEDGTWCDPPEGIQEGIDVEDALEVMTMGSAYAVKRDHEIGSIEAGKYADFVILSEDPTAVDPHQLVDIDVELTMVGGVPAYCGPAYGNYC